MMAPFEQIVRAHGEVVLRVCRMVAGPDDADDAWSETFLAAMRAYPDLAGDADVRAWLVTIAHRRSIDVLRARARRATPVGDVPDQPVPDPPDRTVWHAVARLPDMQRQAVAYHYLAGLPHGEVAMLMGGTAQGVRRAAADGIASLRRMLGAPTTPPEASP